MKKKKEEDYFSKKQEKQFEFIFQGKKLIFEVDQLASKSDKSILCRYGNTTVLTALTVNKLTKNANSFSPLTVTFEGRFYAIGKIPNSFSKRENRSSYKEITTARLIDRALRSFFPTTSEREVKIINSVFSVDQECDPQIAAAWNSSLVCLVSPEIPFFCTPLATININKEKGGFVYNSNNERLNESSLELTISATERKIVTLELKAQEITESELEEAIEVAQKNIQLIINFFQHIASTLEIKKDYHPLTNKKEIGELSTDKWLKEEINCRLEKIISSKNFSWAEREKKMKEICQELTEDYYKRNNKLEIEYVKNLVERLWDVSLQNLMRKLWKKKQARLDGRGAYEIRPLEIQIDYLPNVHGSAVFARGETKVLSVVTIGKISEKQLINDIFSCTYKHFIHHYNFLPFSVNKIISHRTISRREIGHGELVEKSFNHLIPSVDIFPYTIRAVSEVLSSDGSSSQASICATSLALMRAGVPLEREVVGISLGLFDGQIYIDINGLEDKLGEMDCKIAGTIKGICSIQLDVKNQGISLELLKNSLKKARQAHAFLLSEIKRYTNRYSRPNLPAQVIKCKRIYIKKEKLGLIIGKGGKNINWLTEKTGVAIEIQNSGYILIYHQKENKLEEAYRIIKEMAQSYS